MNEKDSRSIKITRRIARIWGGVIIVLGSLMFIGEIIEGVTTQLDPYPWFENIIPFTMFTSVVGLAIAYRREGLGGAITVISLLINFGVYLLTGRGAVLFVLLLLTPIMIPGLLYLVCWRMGQQAPSASLSA